MGATWISWSLAIAMSHLISTSDGTEIVNNHANQEMVYNTSQSYVNTEHQLPLQKSTVIQRINEKKSLEQTDLDMYITNPSLLLPVNEENMFTTTAEIFETTTTTDPYTTLSEILKINLLPSSIDKVQMLPPEFLTKPPHYDNPHPCLRQCIEGEKPMTCNYRFELSWYYAMSKACHNCATNFTDCFRQDCISVDGIKRTVIVINRSIPGPSIEVCLGDTIVVDLVNHMPDETASIHWHGHHQRGSPFMDGVPFITQCPVLPNNMFRYKYLASNAGTHFWHSHTGVQRGDGALGSFIVRIPATQDPQSDFYEFDLPEHTITVLDWSHQLGVTMFAAHYHSDGDNKPQSMIVNGRGRYYNDSLKVTNSPLATFSVKQGSRYRFRLINAGVQNCPIELSIDNHTVTIISSDGFDLEPKTVDAFVSYAGERWDFILEANEDIDNYWMRFTGLMDCDERFNKAHQVAILHYEGASYQEPKGPVGYNIHEKSDLQLNSLNVKRIEEGTLSVPDLVSLDGDDDPSLKLVPDHQLYISFDFYSTDNPHYHKPKLYGFWEVSKKERVYTPQFNFISMKLPTFPLLSQYDSIDNKTFCDHTTLHNCNSTFCECTNVINIPLGDVVELILIDKGVIYNANHPFHLHGHAFRVIGMDRLGNVTDEETIMSLDKAGHIYRNFTKPPKKDTVTVPDGGYTIVRFHATNPGYWLFHCHIEFHMEVGMALIFKVGEHSDFPPVPPEFPTCGNYYYPSQKRSGSTKEIDFHDGVNHLPTFTYNVTHQDNEIDSILSFNHWWPLVANKTHVSSSGVRYSNYDSVTVIIFFILNAINFL